ETSLAPERTAKESQRSPRLARHSFLRAPREMVRFPLSTRFPSAFAQPHPCCNPLPHNDVLDRFELFRWPRRIARVMSGGSRLHFSTWQATNFAGALVGRRANRS